MLIDSNAKNGYNSVAFALTEYIVNQNQTPIILCVGCDRVVGDSLAPMVGELLKNKYMLPTYVYGDLELNITAQNIMSYIRKVKEWHKGAPIIVVDATLGDSEQVGCVHYYKGGCYPAGIYTQGVGKIGDYCILGVVGEKGTNQAKFLHGINLKIVKKLSEEIAKAIWCAFRYSDAIVDKVRQDLVV